MFYKPKKKRKKYPLDSILTKEWKRIVKNGGWQKIVMDKMEREDEWINGMGK